MGLAQLFRALGRGPQGDVDRSHRALKGDIVARLGSRARPHRFGDARTYVSSVPNM